MSLRSSSVHSSMQLGSGRALVFLFLLCCGVLGFRGLGGLGFRGLGVWGLGV